ncbi:unnamed protein product [Closterium sp. NIES-65]|nr:unnamed protein product [Closterium sp. NIES-65]
MQAMDPQAMADGVHHQAYDGGLAMQVVSEESEPPESQQPYSPLNIHDLLPIEAARVRFLHLIIDHFVTYHIVPISEESQLAASHSPGERRKRRAREMEDGQPPVEQQVIRPSYEGDPRHLLPLIFLANAYETLVGEVNGRMAEMDVLRGKTMGLALEAAGGLYRRMVEKFPKSGAVTIFRRREMASALEARARFPQLVLGRDDKRVRFIVVHGLELVERPSTMSPDDAEWFKRITGRHEVAIYPRDFKYFTPRPKPRRVPQPSVSAVSVANPAELAAPMHHMAMQGGMPGHQQMGPGGGMPLGHLPQGPGGPLGHLQGGEGQQGMGPGGHVPPHLPRGLLPSGSHHLAMVLTPEGEGQQGTGPGGACASAFAEGVVAFWVASPGHGSHPGKCIEVGILTTNGCVCMEYVSKW